MLLRKITEHLKTQNWVAAFLDFTIVVLGIFVGLQVDSWNHDRKDRVLESRYLARLHNELTEDLSNFEKGQSLVKERFEQIELLYKAIEDPHIAAVQPDKFVAAVEMASWRSYLPNDRSVYAELHSTGRMTLLRSEHLRAKLASYYAEIDNWAPLLTSMEFQAAYTHDTPDLLTKDQLTFIEETYWGVRERIGIEKETAVAIAEDFTTRPRSTRWLPRMYHHHVLVKHVLEVHSQNAQKIIDEIELLKAN